MRKILSFVFIAVSFCAAAQKPAVYSTGDILQQLQKLKVFGAVLYVAAHPDDENTRLLAYLANEKKYRTAYLSLTRGDGGQNLIGNEQGIDLGLIRTQELLAARRIDGAEQFFSRAYDFGYSKSPEEALKIWGHDKILSDVVWVIRKFQPDIIITRFPTTGEGGHGHHTASAILAGEAFDAAADSAKFPEQFKYGLRPWQAKRLLWNTFNFGGNNTQRPDQFKMDCGVFNPLLGKSYGEIAAEGRSQHKSQGFGVPAQRGELFEYFSAIKGDKPVNDLMDGVATGFERLEAAGYDVQADNLLKNFNPLHPENSVKALIELYSLVEKANGSYWKTQKLSELTRLIEACSGIFMEAVAQKQLYAPGDSVKGNIIINKRQDIQLQNMVVKIADTSILVGAAEKNKNVIKPVAWFLPANTKTSQPYWLQNKMKDGAFEIDRQDLIGLPQVNEYQVFFAAEIEGKSIAFVKPLLYKFTDPVKGELYQPVCIIPPVFINSSPSLLLFNSNKKNEIKYIDYSIQPNTELAGNTGFVNSVNGTEMKIFDSVYTFKAGEKFSFKVPVNGNSFANNSHGSYNGVLQNNAVYEHQYFSLNKISYDHIPDIVYSYMDAGKIIKLDLKTSGSRAGYIAGAGDKIPEALMQMGYEVTMLQENDITSTRLKNFDVVITGIRAYNVHTWLGPLHKTLMEYVFNGGVLLNQYSTNNFISSVNGKMSPYPFTIGRTRVSEEDAAVEFLLPADPLLNYPNKITQKDFEGWVQERSVYQAENTDKNFRSILSMADAGEKAQAGSLITASYGKGKYVYTGLSFFRQLPAGVPGAYRLFANLIARPK
ncbi:MAG: PIG-L family deacetylase [Ferruginibacter sp.]